MIALGVLGATGRMGKSLLLAALNDRSFRVVSGLASKRSPHLGKDLGELLLQEPIGAKLESEPTLAMEKAGLIIDVSSPIAAQEHLQTAVRHKRPLIIGSTGHSSETKLAMESAAKEIPLLYAPNFTLGISLCMEALRLFADKLKGSCFIDIIETHHVKKKDAPSGTALALANALQYGRICPGTMVEHPRSKETIAIHSIRSGEVIGEHRTIFECAGERIEIKHEVLSRDAFALGALRAAKFLFKQGAGFYTMQDIHE